jgi:PAS domain S-box-containing protein
LPILHDHGAMGVLFLRSKGKSPFEDHELSLVTTLANAMAIALRNARILQSLRDATEKSRSARAEAERRVQLFQRYADFFESAADGMVVIDREGRLLFANPRAREITGFSETELMALRFEDFLAPLERDRIGRLLRGFRDGIYPRGVDIAITDKSGVQLTISVSFSSVLHEDNAVVFSFRDVTHERATAIELKQTKEFLESVIDSSVDGIVSANLRGTVLLFNRAAARIFGYSPSDVVGKMRVEKLYPPGVAHDIMKKIRDPSVSGYGRLEDHRVDMLNSNGEPIQVLLSASLVIDNGRPIGSVGIFTDIREKLRMEARLEKAQDELRSREKQAIVAELAGAAAHELNQPLTSVIGYAELLRRQLEEHPQLSHAASVIVGESERMAEIVRKVGKITKYETKSYVGAAKILDLDKATEKEPGDQPQ